MLTPTIPETITVHLGAPDENVANVTVSFPDYIKNVASGEIYPTWPESALRANIYAQISYALNRVYLEFYRAQGYDFDITNTTALDQSYSQGRNIFSNISDIVDDIFDSYISRQGTIEPLAAKFCNGTTVTCEGLSQWGSVSLAEEGYIPYDILTYYYGNNIDIIQDAPIQNLPESYPGTPQRLGSEGAPVTTIQFILNTVSNNYPAIPKIYPITGVFDQKTEDAVKRFQSIFELTPDGIVGRQTWYKLIFLYSGLRKLSELDSEGIDLYTETQPQITAVNTDLKKGTSSAYVELLQYLLSFLAQFYPNFMPVTITGTYDKQTEEAVIAAQRFFNLPQTGEANNKTFHFIYSAYITLARFLDTRDYDFKNFTTLPKSVTQVQQMLNIISKLRKNIQPVSVTGYIGPKTRENIRKIQRLYNLSVTGDIDNKTRSAIAAEVNHTQNAVSPSFTQYPGYELKNGMSDAQLQTEFSTTSTPIKNMQNLLRTASLIIPQMPEIVPLGFFDDVTETAVKTIQNISGLAQTGIVDLQTWEAILNEYYTALEETANPLPVSPFPDTNLPFLAAETGDYICFAQIMMNTSKKVMPEFQTQNLSCIADDITRNNIKHLQKVLNRPQTGLLDKGTWNGLVKIYESVTKGIL